MAEVFISYSRSDHEFVRRLHGELAKREVEAWVDWEDIPPSAEWWGDICSAVEKTDAVVFVMSPDSIASRVCSDELAHAVRHNKHLIPVVWRPVDPRTHPSLEIPASLAKINWIFFRLEEDEFSAACDQLVTAASTDLDWVHAHSRALTRAIEWDRQRRDDSFLLRKNDLTQAEAWLAKGPEKDPKPTVLQTEYIIASRRAAIRTRRRLHTAIWSTAAVLLVIGAIALWQYRLSEERGRNDFSRQLSNLSRSALETQPDLALLLAAEAHAVANTFDARNALLTGLHKVRGVSAFLHPDGQVYKFDVSPDGSHAAIVKCQVSSGTDGGCKTYRLQLVRLRDRATVAHRDFTSWVSDLVFRKKDGMLGVLRSAEDGSGLVEWLRVPSLRPAARLRLPAGSDDESAMFLGSNRILTESSVVRDASSGKIVARLPLQGVGYPPVIAAHPTAPVFLILGGTGEAKVARLWDARTNEVRILPGDGEPGEYKVAAFSGDGSKFAAGGCAVPTVEGFCREGEVEVWSLGDRGIEHHSVRNLPEAVEALVFLPQADLLVSGGCASMGIGKCARGEIRFWDFSGGLEPAGVSPLHADTVTRLRASSDGAVLLSGDWAGLILWRMGSADGVFRPSLPSGIPSGALVDSAEIAPAGPKGATLRATAPQLSATCSPGDRDCAGPVRAKMQIGQAVDLDPLLASFRGDPVRQAIWLVRSAEGQKLAIAGCGRAQGDGSGCASPRLIVVDLGDGRQRPMPAAGLEGEITAAGFDRTGRYLATASCHGELQFECDHSAVRVWDLSDPGKPPAVMDGQGYVSAVAFAPDTKTLALGICTLSGSIETPENRICRGGEVRLLSLATGKAQSLPLPGYPALIQSVAVAADGLTIAASGEEGGIGVWDVERGELLGPPFIAAPDRVSPVELSGNSRLESGPPGARIVWTLDPMQWRERACRIANRRLSADERRRYLLDEPGRPDACAVKEATASH